MIQRTKMTWSHRPVASNTRRLIEVCIAGSGHAVNDRVHPPLVPPYPARPINQDALLRRLVERKKDRLPDPLPTAPGASGDGFRRRTLINGLRLILGRGIDGRLVAALSALRPAGATSAVRIVKTFLVRLTESPRSALPGLVCGARSRGASALLDGGTWYRI